MPDSALILEKYFFWLVIYSVIGWVYESALESFRQKKLVNRGFLNGPYCPIYGFGSLLDVIILGNLKYNPVLLFVASAVLTCILEYITSVVMEKIFNVRWWDYNDFKFTIFGKEIFVGKFNINGRICLVGALAFGTLSILLVYFIHPFIVSVTDRFSYPLFHYICVGLLILILIDCLHTVLGFSTFNDKLKSLSANINQIKGNINDKFQSTSAYEKINSAYERFVKSLNHQQIRLIHSFSHLRSIKYRKISEEVRKFVFRKDRNKNKKQ